MLYIVPSRGRPHNVRDLLESWVATTDRAELLIVVDNDDPTLDGYRALDLPLNVAMALIDPLGGLGPTLNHFATYHAGLPDHAVIGFMGDDHRPRTPGWDLELVTAAANGNDKFQGPNLPTAVALDTRIIAAVGYMVPPGLTHLYVDNVWKEWGQALGALRYLPHVEIEHVHPAARKAPDDERYAFVNSQDMWQRDGLAYTRYMDTRFWDDVRKMKEALA